MSDLLRCQALDIAVDECLLVANLNLQLPAGSITAVLGRNGTGKSLTLHTLAGLRPASAGAVWLGRRPLMQLPRRERAQQLSFVPQNIEAPFPVSVLECALSGRHPHIDFWQWETTQDRTIARAALAAVDMREFEQRNIETLSGGERRRLAIATALTQQPQVFVLDEPTNHLDPQHQLQVLKLLRRQADAGGAVIMSLHDPNLAARFADHVLLLHGDGTWLHGALPSVLTAENLSRLYRVTALNVRSASGPGFEFI